MSSLNNIKRALSKIQVAYTQGAISYPRVANNYITDDELKFYEYPHRPLVSFDEYSNPFPEKNYPFSKEMLLIELTNLSIATPATLFKELSFIDETFDDNMDFRKGREDIDESLDEVISLMRELAVFLYEEEEVLGINNGERDYSIEENEEVLHFLSKDGTLSSSFKMNIRPYSILLSPTPYNQPLTKEQERWAEVEEDTDTDTIENKEEQSQEERRAKRILKNMLKPIPKYKPSCFKSFVSPSRNLNIDTIISPIFVKNFDEVIKIENTQIEKDQRTQKREEIKQYVQNKAQQATIFKQSPSKGVL